jgi:hypothetical protein
VHVDGQRHLVADRGPDRLDLADHPVDLAPVEGAVPVVVAQAAVDVIHIELQRREPHPERPVGHGLEVGPALRRRGVGQLGQVVSRRVHRAGVAVGVEAHLLSEGPAEELVDRDAVQLAGEVPQRHLQARDRSHHGAALAPGEDVPAAHLLGQPVHVAGVFPDQLLGEGPDDGVDRGDRRRWVTFSEPVRVAGPQPHDEAGADDAHGGGLDPGYPGVAQLTTSMPVAPGRGFAGRTANLGARGHTLSHA